MHHILSLMFLLAALAPALAVDLSPAFKWFVHTESPAPQRLEMFRGESMFLEPTFLNYNDPVDLTGTYTIDFRYQPQGETNWFYMQPGTVYNATAGVAHVRLDGAAWSLASSYNWDMTVSGSSSTICRAYGTLSLRNTVADKGSTNSPARRYNVLDFSMVELLNVDLSPFLTSFETNTLNTYIQAMQDGTASLDITNLNVRGTQIVNHMIVNGYLYGSAASLTSFPDYLARKTDIPTDYANDIQVGDASLVGGEVLRNGPHGWIVKFPYLSAGELSQTNRLYWIVGGDSVGYVSTNGVTITKGSLRLFEDDLNCNVRAYDGSREAPSMSFLNSPDRGWYSKSVDGSYAWAYTVRSNGVLWIASNRLEMANGVSLVGENAFDNVKARKRLLGVQYYTPRYQGDILADESEDRAWMAMGLGTNDWLELMTFNTLTQIQPLQMINKDPATYTPRFAGDMLLDATSNKVYVSSYTTANSWQLLLNPSQVSNQVTAATSALWTAWAPNTMTNGDPKLVVPRYVGDRLIATATNKMWQANGVTTNSWLQIYP